ncbi:MAG: helix-turn-helix domain-containing protein [Alphaproteobacteria bacterium]
MVGTDTEVAISPPGRRAIQVAETRAKLTAAGAQVFAASGFHAASMADVAGAAGLSQGAAYNHFAGKDAVFAAAFEADEPFAGLIEAISREGAVGSDVTFEERLLRAVQNLAQGPGRGWFDLLLIDMVEFDGRHWRALYQRHRSGFARAAGRIEASGRLTTVGGAAALRALIAAALGQTLVARLLAAGEDGVSKQEQTGSAISLILKGALAAD